MITGYNNDIKHGGSVFHVQTEDKGEASAWIESLIYVGGRILARKRATYKQLLQGDGDKAGIAKLMERQHRLMIQQIRDGRFDDSEGGAPGEAKKSDPQAPGEEKIAQTRMRQQAEAMFADVGADAGDEESSPRNVEPTPAPAGADLAAAAAGAVAQEPQAAGEPAAEDGEGEAPSLDQVIFDYLSSIAKEESLVLLMDESPALASDTTTRMDLGTHASRSGKPIARAQIAVRMISKVGGPMTLAEGTTDEDGTLQLVVAVPAVPENSAALIISAASHIGNAEIKHLL